MTVLTARWSVLRKWQEEDHPRDARGRFINVGSWVRAWIPGVGTTVGEVTASPGGGQLQVRTRAGWVAMVAGRDIDDSDLPPMPSADPPGTATVRQLLDPGSDLTPARLRARLAAGDGTVDERAEWAAGADWFDDAAARAAADDLSITYLAGIVSSPDPGAAVRATLPHLAGDAQAGLMQMLHGEMAHRAGQPGGMRHGVRRWDGPADGPVWAERHLQAPDMTRDEIRAARAYIKDPSINRTLRGLEAAGVEDRDQVAALDAAQGKSRLPQPILVTRGTGVAALEQAGVQGRNDDEGMYALVGQILTDPGYLSTSVSSEPPGDFATADVQWLIRVPRDTPALYLGTPPFDGIDGEHELLLGRDSRLLVHGVYRGPDREYRPTWGGSQTISGQWFVEAEVVPDGWQPGPGWVPQPYGDAYAGYGDGRNEWVE
ncbi:ADP-ribosyltransferase [Micromonospora haikouensis]|uniref:ADP-ribosyltransferase n=1 Tax=Micromonospora haikouensis TaxID=686309 RepID=UPI003D7400FE